MIWKKNRKFDLLLTIEKNKICLVSLKETLIFQQQKLTLIEENILMTYYERLNNWKTEVLLCLACAPELTFFVILY